MMTDLSTVTDLIALWPVVAAVALGMSAPACLAQTCGLVGYTTLG
jgi:hypothetical protein